MRRQLPTQIGHHPSCRLTLWRLETELSFQNVVESECPSYRRRVAENEQPEFEHCSAFRGRSKSELCVSAGFGTLACLSLRRERSAQNRKSSPALLAWIAERPR